ncbi:MAG: chorismate-binding protein [Nitrospiria bacterium]
MIRTLFLNDKIGFIQTGAGIVADSIPQKEFEETLQKAEALFKAVSDSE